MLATILIFAVILLVLVLIHEFGHFISAKKLGVKVEEFAFGFPPRLFSFKKGETNYSINALPIGGYVKLYGEDEAGGGKIRIKDEGLRIKDEKRAYYAQKPGKKLLIGVAGVFMNAVLAAVIFYIYFFISGFKTELQLLPSTNPHFLLANQVQNTQIIVSTVAKDSPAQKAGITAPAIITKVNGRTLESGKQFIDVIEANKGKSVMISWKEGDKPLEITKSVTPRISPPKDEGSLGISFYPFSTLVISYPSPMQKIVSGVIHPVNLMAYNLEVIGSLISASFKQKSAAPLGAGVSGPIGVYSIVGSIVSIPDMKERILNLLNLAGLLSISLAFFNILPIPALDGGRVFFVLIEMVIGKRLNPKFEAWANSIGMMTLLALLLVTTFHDILRQIAGGF